MLGFFLCVFMVSFVMIVSSQVANAYDYTSFNQQVEQIKSEYPDGTEWGNTAPSSQSIIVDEHDIVSICSGSSMSAAVRADGSLWTWGGQYEKHGAVWGNSYDYNYIKECQGLASGVVVIDTPMMVFSGSVKSVVCSSRDVSTSSSGYEPGVPTVAVLKDDGSLWTWGNNSYGQLGIGESITGRYWTPTKVLENVVTYAVSGYHSAAVTTDGSLYTWGRNDYGQLGNRTTNNVYQPVKIMDNVASVALGEYFSAAVKTDGTLWTWGRNNYGQLGNGTTENSIAPVQVLTLTGVKAVALGDSHAVALKTDGTVWTWGSNSYGQLGLGLAQGAYKDEPTATSLSSISKIAAGVDYSAAIQSNGDLWMWGNNQNKTLGPASTTDWTSEPDRAWTKVTQISCGKKHTLVVREDGTLWVWGRGSLGLRQPASTTSYRFADYTQSTPGQVFLGRYNYDYSADGVSKKTLDIPWDDTDLYKDPGIYGYNENLATAGVPLSQFAYYYASGNSSACSKPTALGFEYAGSYQGGSISQPAYSVWYKLTYDFDKPHLEILMAIRGTENIWSNDALTDLKAVRDGFTEAGNYCFNALKTAKNTIANKLEKDGFDMAFTAANTKYFITGHSLGAACAGIVGLEMVDNARAWSDSMFVYTYGSPKYSYYGMDGRSVPGLFNLVNILDAVPMIPQNMYVDPIQAIINDVPVVSSLSRAGTSLYFLPSDSNGKFMTSIYNLYGEYPWDTFLPIKSHMTPVYLSYILSEQSMSNLAQVYSRLVRVHCPVEIEVYDPAGELCAYTSNGEVTYPVYSAVRIVIIEDEKYIELPDDGEYTIKYIGTDTGTMNIEDQIYHAETGEIESEKCFENVILEEGKTFESVIDTTEERVDTELFVINGGGHAIAEVQEDGTEISLGVGYEVALDDYTNGLATITGIKEGEYTGETTFTVACDEACAVFCSTDSKTYTRLTAAAGDNSYSFTVDVTQNMTIVVALKGDVNLDGVLKNQDVTMAKAANLGKRTLSTLQEMVADVTGDGVFKNQDVTKFKATLLGKTTLNWDV